MAGRRARASEDLRGGGSSGIRPGVLQMLFKGGPARGVASADLRTGRNSVKPENSKMLFRGGPARGVASEDLRMGHDGEDRVRPGNEQSLAEGGDVEDVDVGDDLVVAAEDIMDCLQSGYFGGSPSESDSKVERASKEAAKKARAEIFAKALKAFFLMCESAPHEEAGDRE